MGEHRVGGRRPPVRGGPGQRVEEHQRDRERGVVGRDDPRGAPQRVVPPGAEAAGAGGGQREHEGAQHEEQVDGEEAAGEHRAAAAEQRAAGQHPRVVDDHQQGRVAAQPLEPADELHRAAAAMTSTTVVVGSAVESITRW